MNAIFRNHRVRIAVLALFLAQTACTTVVRHSITDNLDESNVTGVTLTSGRAITFDPKGATVSAGTITGDGPHGAVTIPIDSVSEVWVKQPSHSRTLGLIVGIAAVVGGAIALGARSGSTTY